MRAVIALPPATTAFIQGVWPADRKPTRWGEDTALEAPAHLGFNQSSHHP